jgi:hypothetical protein
MALVRRTRGHKRLALPAVVNLRAAVGGANPKRFPETVGQNWEELGELGELGELARWSGQSQNMPENAGNFRSCCGCQKEITQSEG